MPGFNIPDNNFIVAKSRRSQAVTIGTPVDAANEAVMTHQNIQNAAVRDVPNPNRAILASRGQAMTIRVPSDDWWRQERERVLQQDFSNDIYNLYADIVRYDKFRNQFMGLWQVPEDYHFAGLKL